MASARATFLKNRRRDVHSEAPWSQFRYVNKALREVVVALTEAVGLQPGARVLDYGCGVSPYRDVLPRGVEYVGADLEGNPDADVVLRADGSVPVPDDSFDLVLSTQVLEHVEDPALYLRECHRVVRPGGAVIVSTHGIMYYHRDPEDYWRWTRPGLVKVIEATGLEAKELRGVLALSAAALQILQDGTIWKVPRPLKKPFAFVMQVTIGFLDRRYDEVNRIDNCLTLAVRAEKPMNDPGYSRHDA